MKQQVLEKQLRDLRAAIDQMRVDVQGAVHRGVTTADVADRVEGALAQFNQRVDEVLKDADV